MFGHEARAIVAQLTTLNTKVDRIMATEANAQAAVATLSAKEDVALQLMKSGAASVKDPQARVAGVSDRRQLALGSRHGCLARHCR
jgi:hypothetical protein